LNTKTITGYLKWHNDIVGVIYNRDCVEFINPDLNAVVKTIVRGKKSWTPDEYKNFLSDRIVSRSRRDIERILFRLKLCDYDIIKIAEKTCAFNTKDLFWISMSEHDKFEDKVAELFAGVFKMSLDESGDSVISPDGQNIKNYGVYNGRYGIFKKRLSGVMTDIESEIACYKLSNLLGVNVCPVFRVSDDVIFSEFLYDFNKEFIVHARRFFADGERSLDLYADLRAKFPEFTEDIDKMCVFDFITRQDDRHLSNFAIKINDKGVSDFYPLYDNGRSLFFDDNPVTVSNAVKNIIEYSTSFGETGAYYDVADEISKHRKISDFVNLNIGGDEIFKLLSDSGFTDYRLDGCFKWITGAINILKEM